MTPRDQSHVTALRPRGRSHAVRALAFASSLITILVLACANAEAGMLHVQLGISQSGCLAQYSLPKGMTGKAYCNTDPRLPLHEGWDYMAGCSFDDRRRHRASGR